MGIEIDYENYNSVLYVTVIAAAAVCIGNIAE
jgi:hypothetical protein